MADNEAATQTQAPPVTAPPPPVKPEPPLPPGIALKVPAETPTLIPLADDDLGKSVRISVRSVKYGGWVTHIRTEPDGENLARVHPMHSFPFRFQAQPYAFCVKATTLYFQVIEPPEPAE